jgi:membrane-bound lytic murein transglycosylase D
MKIFRFLAVPLLGAMVVIAGCKTEEVHQPAAQPPAEAVAPTLTKPADPAPPPKVEQAAQPKPDPVPELIKQVEDEYAKGEASCRAGHLEAAKESFNRAFDRLLTGPVAVHSDERLEHEFDRLVERVSRLEMLALKEGDGFTAQQSEPAPIDEANEVTFPVDPAVRAKAEVEMRRTHSDLPLVMNDQVASFVNYFSAGKGRGVLERALVRAGRYHEMIARTLREEGVPQDLIYLAQAESGFHPLALSRAGARGIWQFMAGRATGYGLQRTWWVDERQDPEKATRAAAQHLRDLYNQFGDWYLAMAAYNSGPGTVQHAVERTGYADFWELYRRNVLPRETRNYVPIILAVTIVAKNPSQYGLDLIAPETPPAVDTVRVNYAVDLRLVADCVGSSVATLQDLNPSLLRMTTPNDAEFDLKLPAGSAVRFQAAIAAIPVEMRTQWRYHQVEAGETLSQVAQRYRTTARAIAEVNNLEPDAILQQDARLIIPVTPSRRAASEGQGFTYSRRVTLHKVRKGETALSVADDYGVPVSQLRKWNRLQGNNLRVGQTLRIHRPVAGGEQREAASSGSRRSASTAARRPADARASASARSSAPTAKRGSTTAAATKTGARSATTAKYRTHTVKRGETLHSIASSYNTTVAALKRDNGKLLTNLRPGQVLVIK